MKIARVEFIQSAMIEVEDGPHASYMRNDADWWLAQTTEGVQRVSDPDAKQLEAMLVAYMDIPAAPDALGVEMDGQGTA